MKRGRKKRSRRKCRRVKKGRKKGGWCGGLFKGPPFPYLLAGWFFRRRTAVLSYYDKLPYYWYMFCVWFVRWEGGKWFFTLGHKRIGVVYSLAGV